MRGGKGAYVTPVVRRDGTEAVLKIAPPDGQFAAQVRTIRAANGNGYVLIYAHDAGRHAMLMEPLGTMLADAAISPEQALDVQAATLRQAWSTPRPPGDVAPPGEDRASQLIRLTEDLWPKLGQPCSAALIDRVLTYARRRAEAYDPDRSVLCHGDPHVGNLLAVRTPRPGAESGYVFIDPDGIPDDPAYDLGVVVRGWTDLVLASGDPAALIRGFCARLANRTDLDEQSAWEWGFIERVTTGLYLSWLGHPEESRAYLASGERLLESSQL